MMADGLILDFQRLGRVDLAGEGAIVAALELGDDLEKPSSSASSGSLSALGGNLSCPARGSGRSGARR